MRKRDTTAGPPLDSACVAVVLEGWTARPRDGSRADTPAAFDLCRSGTAGVALAWRRHEAFLRREAVRLGIEPMEEHEGRPMFFGEWCCLSERDQAAYWDHRTAEAAAAFDDDDDEDGAIVYEDTP